MKNNEEYIYKATEPKIIVYDYLFNYFGKDTFDGKIILGACVQLAIRAYIDDTEVKFTEEPKCYLIDKSYAFFNEIFNVSFDREKLFTIHKKLIVDKLFRSVFGWNKIVPEVVGYTLDCLDVIPNEIMKDMPEQFKNLPCSSPMEVSEKDFREFLSKHIDDFDILDNVNAQVPSILFI